MQAATTAEAVTTAAAPSRPRIQREADGLLRVEFERPPDAATCAWLFDELARLDRAHPVRGILGVAPSSAMPDAAARNVIYRRRQEVLHHRVAVVGESAFQGFLVNFLVTAIAHRSARYFLDEDAARAWLREPRHAG